MPESNAFATPEAGISPRAATSAPAAATTPRPLLQPRASQAAGASQDLGAVIRALEPEALQRLLSALVAPQPAPPATGPDSALGQAEGAAQQLLDFQQRADIERRRLEADHRLRLEAAERENAALRAQYDLLAIRNDGATGVNSAIDADRIGAPNQTCALLGCDRRPWPGHPYCGKTHAAAAKYQLPRPAADGGSVFGDDLAEDALPFAAPAPVPGTFGIADPSSEFPGLSVDWVRWIAEGRDKARKFSREEWKILGALQQAGRIVGAMGAHFDLVVDQLPPDSEAGAIVLELSGATSSLLDILQRSVDNYALRWNHSPQRYEAFVHYASLYEPQAAGPRCMHPGNLALQHQVALVDLRQAKSALSKAKDGGGRAADGARNRQRASADSASSAPAGRSGSGRGGGGGGGSGGGGAKRSGAAGAAAATPQ